MLDDSLSLIDIVQGVLARKAHRGRKRHWPSFHPSETLDLFHHASVDRSDGHQRGADQIIAPPTGKELSESLYHRTLSRLDREAGHSPFAIPKRAGEEPRLPCLGLEWPNPPRRGGVRKRSEALFSAMDVAFCQERRLVLARHPEGGCRDRGACPDADYSLVAKLHAIGDQHFVVLRVIARRDARLVSALRIDLGEMFDLASATKAGRDAAHQIARAVERREMSDYPRCALSQAYRQLLLGERQIERLTLPGIGWARQATLHGFTIAPDFPRASAVIARTYYLEWITGGGDREALLNEGRRWAVHGTRIDPSSGESFRELGLIEVYQGRFDAGLGALAEAEKVAPDDPETLVAYADALCLAGRHAEAEKKIDRAMLLHRGVPDICWWTAASISYHRGQYADAVNLIDRMVHAGPANRFRAAAYSQLGRGVQSRECAVHVMEAMPTFEVGGWLAKMPYRHPHDREHLARGLREAGLPK